MEGAFHVHESLVNLKSIMALPAVTEITRDFLEAGRLTLSASDRLKRRWGRWK
jgi:hypothetical protein